MKQKIIIAMSVVLLLLAVVLIARDLFRSSPALTESCCEDETSEIKKIDSTQLGFYRAKFWETGIKGLTGIFVNEKGIVAGGNRMIVIFDTAGNRIGSLSIDSSIFCITVNEDEIFAGIGNGAISFDFSGKEIKRFHSSYTNSFITSIAVSEEYVYLADAGKKRVLKFSRDGNMLQEIGMKDSTSGADGFVVPSPYFDIVCGEYNDLWIVNPGRLRVENFSASGIKRFEWGNELAAEIRFTGCCNPAQLAILPDGSFVTYEKGNDRMKLFDATGSFQTMVAGAGSFKGKPDFLLGKNNLVKDLATDATGAVYVLDAYNRINVFKMKVSSDRSKTKI